MCNFGKRNCADGCCNTECEEHPSNKFPKSEGTPRIMQCDEPECHRKKTCTHSVPHDETDICTRPCTKGPGRLTYCVEVKA
jgi:hypothetical protein